MKLTEHKIEKLAIESGRKDRLIFDNEQRGLAVRVTASGGRTYLCQYTIHGHKWRVPWAPVRQCHSPGRGRPPPLSWATLPRGVIQPTSTAAAERARRARNRLTLRVLIEDWKRVHFAARRPRYAAEAVRALHYAFADHLDDPAEDLDRATVVRALDAFTRRRKRKDGEGPGKARGAAITGRTAAYGRAAFAWAVKRGAVRANPFQHCRSSRARPSASGS